MGVFASPPPSADTWPQSAGPLRAPLGETAVETFSRWHEQDVPDGESPTPATVRIYRDLIPVSAPRPGEQYAFEVDLDECSGCKACVVACHSLNGLETDELWRDVGLLTGGTDVQPFLQHVTTACHHCLEPACLEGCPVLAFEKDPVTGIVRHLDDQCIGCQYCILKCPYDVPKYSAAKGIVRKCDMCRDRLAVDQAPACVQSCPNRAIRITLVDRAEVREHAEAGSFLPGAPEPSYTLPTTIYKTANVWPRNVLPADYYTVAPSHNHRSLVSMLVLTQMSVGAFVTELWLHWFAAADSPIEGGSARSISALVLGLIGMGAAIFHLGRPRYAFRAIIGLQTSWLSREILAFSLFALAAAGYAGTAILLDRGNGTFLAISEGLGAVAALAGIAGVICSIMIYVDTRRPFWNGTDTTGKFLLTSIACGLSVVLMTSLARTVVDGGTSRTFMANEGSRLCAWLIAATLTKLLFECLAFRHLAIRQHTPLKRSAMLLKGALRSTVQKRFAAGLIGGVVLPAILLASQTREGSGGYSDSLTLLITAASFGCVLLGEILERTLFFTASVAPKMPGTMP